MTACGSLKAPLCWLETIGEESAGLCCFTVPMNLPILRFSRAGQAGRNYRQICFSQHANLAGTGRTRCSYPPILDIDMGVMRAKMLRFWNQSSKVDDRLPETMICEFPKLLFSLIHDLKY